jgi:ribonuclease D
LSYFHTLIDQGRHNFETSYYPQGLKGLIEKYFPGYTLKKDESMHQDWLAPLENPDLKAYAVADAYAGLMLYHRMNAKRLEMKPCPPLPARVEETRLYSEYSPGIPEPKPIYLQPLHPSGSSRQAHWFFSMEEDNEVSTDHDTDSEALYNRLVKCRERVAGEVEIYSRQLTTNCALRTIALTRPKTSDDCMKLRGLFPQLRKILAKEYAKVVTSFQEEIQRVRSMLFDFDWNTYVCANRQSVNRKFMLQQHMSKLDVNPCMSLQIQKVPHQTAPQYRRKESPSYTPGSPPL